MSKPSAKNRRSGALKVNIEREPSHRVSMEVELVVFVLVKHLEGHSQCQLSYSHHCPSAQRTF